MMKLAPLPTTAVTHDKHTEQAPFPYPKFGEGGASQPVNVPPVAFEPLAQQQASSPPQDDENSRMAELENMLNEAQSRAAMIEQEAYDKAYAAGEKSGLALGEKRAEQLVEAMQQVVNSAEQELTLLKSESIDAVLDISLAVIEHVVGSEDENFSQILETSVSRVLSQFLVGYEGQLTLAIHAQDLDTFHRMSSLSKDIKIRAHANVLAGTCRLITDEQDILIDPKQSIRDAVQSVRDRLLNHV